MDDSPSAPDPEADVLGVTTGVGVELADGSVVAVGERTPPPIGPTARWARKF
jgi:hypothetical protein